MTVGVVRATLVGVDADGLTELVAGTWLRSFEEEPDDGDLLVFRPPSYHFPPTRAPRDRYSLSPDGELVASSGPAPSDRPEQAEGSWRLSGTTLHVDSAAVSGDFAVERVETGLLVVRPVAAGADASPEGT